VGMSRGLSAFRWRDRQSDGATWAQAGLNGYATIAKLAGIHALANAYFLVWCTNRLPARGVKIINLSEPDEPVWLLRVAKSGNHLLLKKLLSL
jgi:hypothetical protein